MKEFTAFQYHPTQGVMSIKMRFEGRHIYLKEVDSPEPRRMMMDLKKKGAEIVSVVINHKSTWTRIDIFHNQTLVRLGDKEFDVTEISEAQVEQILYDFFIEKYKQAKFSIRDGDTYVREDRVGKGKRKPWEKKK